MRLILQEADEEIRRDMSAELTRVEQYADMIMAYVRLESSGSSTDYVFREVKLDNVIKNVLRKYSGVFIRKKLTLKYEQTDASVTGDEKWISFILEQLISNALKYTPRGEISVTVHDGGKISVSDSGIGIPKEDLPMIFEKGYTGLNGRADERASGIGLYLIKRVCRSLGYSISVESEVGQGSTFTVDLSRSEIGMND
ncbi:MAG: sensor histidine kinase, partial [Eubacteriales bacterium]